MVCLFIATKSEETVKKLRLMLPVVHPILVQQLLKMTKEEVQVEMVGSHDWCLFMIYIKMCCCEEHG